MVIPKESGRLRKERIAGTCNGMTLRTRVARDRKRYTRKEKHCKKSIADAMDFSFHTINDKLSIPKEMQWTLYWKTLYWPATAR